MVATTGTVEVLVTEKDEILPVPPAARPMEVLELIQLYTVPGTFPMIITGEVEARWHNTWFATVLTDGVGFTVIMKDVEVPVHVNPALANVGTTLIVAVWGPVVVLVTVNDKISPDPEEARPMEVFELVQLYSVPGTFPDIIICEVEARWHKTWFPTVFTVGMGFTVILKEAVFPVHVRPALVNVGVTTTTAVTGTVVVLVTVNEEILPVPAAARPMEVFELIQLYTVPGTLPEVITDEVEA